MEDLENLNSDDYSNLLVKKEQEYRAALESLSIVEAEDLRLSRDIIELQLKRKNLTIAITQGKYNVRRISSEKKELERRFWDSKR